jgi:flagellar protein FliJ
MSALHTLLTQAEAERDQARAALRRAEDQLTRLRAQAEQLHAYRGEYQQRWGGQFAQGGAIEIVHCYQSFMQRLDEALVQQRQQSEAAAALAERQRAVLLATEMRVASVRKLLERRQIELRRVQDRREQRQNDETAQQLHWRHTSSSH